MRISRSVALLFVLSLLTSPINRKTAHVVSRESQVLTGIPAWKMPGLGGNVEIDNGVGPHAPGFIVCALNQFLRRDLFDNPGTTLRGTVMPTGYTLRDGFDLSFHGPWPDRQRDLPN